MVSDVRTHTQGSLTPLTSYCLSSRPPVSGHQKAQESSQQRRRLCCCSELLASRSELCPLPGAGSCGGTLHSKHFRMEGGGEGWVGTWVKQSDEIFLNPLQCTQISVGCQVNAEELLPSPCCPGDFLEEKPEGAVGCDLLQGSHRVCI